MDKVIKLIDYWNYWIIDIDYECYTSSSEDVKGKFNELYWLQGNQPSSDLAC
jgi:hypothetical protein